MPRVSLNPGERGDFQVRTLDDGRIRDRQEYCRFDGVRKRTETRVLGIAIFVSMPSTVLYPRDGSPLRDLMTTVLPESWPFFTKPPSDTEITAYVLDDGILRSASAFPNSHPDNWFGVLRTQRAQGPEMANLTSPLPAENWVECAEDRSRDCLLIAAETEPVSIVNDYPTQTLCGKVIIVETAPVAFSYRDMYEGWRLDENAVHLDIKC